MSQAKISPEIFKQKLIDVFGDDTSVCQAVEAGDFITIYQLLYPYGKWPHGGGWLGRRGAPFVTPRWLLNADNNSIGRRRRDALLRKYDEAPWMLDWLKAECARRRLKIKWPSLLKDDDGDGYLLTAV